LKKLLLALLLGLAALGYWLYARASAPPELAFTRVQRMRLESVLTTNGKVEPIEWAAARAEREGPLARLNVTKGQTVAKGFVLATLDSGDTAAELRSAQARIDQVKAEIALLEAGGRAAELAEIENGLRRAQLDRATATREIATLERLVEKNAVPRQELLDMRERLDKADVQIRALENRRRALIDRASVDGARARLREAEANAVQIQQRLDKSVVRSPLTGVVYSLDLKPGAWVAPGTVIASIGRIDRVKVLVYVDEPELGRVQVGMPVRITWDALGGREWRGTVDRKPTEIMALNTRQVGEVVCLIENEGGDLLPGTNINAFIQSKVVASALTIPKETLRREGGDLGVFTLNSGNLEFRKLTLGASSVTRSEVVEGLKEGDAVLLPTDENVRTGQPVRAVYQP
jgi:HlyD family secretion protein